MDEDLQRVLVSLASRSNFISYDELMSALNIDNVRQLEDFIIQAISQEIIKGRLNPRERKLEVNDWASHKIGDDLDMDFMAQTLSVWIQHCDSFVKSLGEEVERSNQQMLSENTHEKKVEEEAEKIRKIIFTQKYGRGGEENFVPTAKSVFKNDAKRYKSTTSRLRRN